VPPGEAAAYGSLLSQGRRWFGKRRDDGKHTSALPRRNAPGSCIIFPPRKRAWGMPDAQCTRSRAWCVVNTRVSHHESTGIIRHSRTRMVLTVSFALSPVIGLVCHRRQRSCLHQLDAGVEASGPHDFAVRERHPQKPLGGVGTVPPKSFAKADQRRPSCAAAASTASRSNVRDDRETPLKWDGMTQLAIDRRWRKSKIFLLRGTGQPKSL
jgi:hypothetical protein